MFSHRLSYFFAGLLGLYSFLNIYFLDGDRLYAVKLQALPLLAIILLLTYSVWFTNQLIQKVAVDRVKIAHPLIVQFLISTLSMVLISLISTELTGLVFGGPFQFSFQNFLLTLAFTSRINLFLNSLNAIFFFNSKLKEKAIEAEKLKSLNSEAKLESINSQLNPHFFFNNLSALSVLIHKDVQLADRYLLQLSEVYRYILKNRGNELVTLQEEVNFLSHYLELLSIRFEDSFRFSLDIKSACFQKLLPPAVLQLLVENVVKHNFFTRKQPMDVTLYCEEGILKMRNPKQPKPAIEPSTGIGLQNISDRYRFLNFEIKVIDKPDFFQVELPLIDEQKITFGRG